MADEEATRAAGAPWAGRRAAGRWLPVAPCALLLASVRTGVASQARESVDIWLVEAADHRFSGNIEGLDRALLDALAWVKSHPTG